jgi:hypothetical protein
MSLGIVFKGPEGIVLAADSRVTLNATLNPPNQFPLMLPATFDNATKLLRVNGQDFVGAVTFGLGALGHSFMPEFEAELSAQGCGRLSVEDFATKLGQFFMKQWEELKMPKPTDWNSADPMIFLVGGYDSGAAYGRVFEVNIPHMPKPVELNSGVGNFGAIWGGQRAFADRLIQGFDSGVPAAICDFLKLPAERQRDIEGFLKHHFSVRVPYQFLPLQDCVDLSIFLIRSTISLQTWLVDIRGVGGHIDVATITKTEGFVSVQQKSIRGERS